MTFCISPVLLQPENSLLTIMIVRASSAHGMGKMVNGS